jgi:prepilin-type N-terminal cleavage/methylation domain-containing protein
MRLKDVPADHSLERSFTMRRKGFTLVELLVVIAIIALLMGILMPALARVRQLAFRMVCGTNLSGIGKAMLIYANDYEDELPKAGGRTNAWAAKLPDWTGVTRQQAYGITSTNGQGQATITSNFYLLVKYAEVTPKQFVCKGETDAKEFKLSEASVKPNKASFELIDAWDFGPYVNESENPSMYCSYSYHYPFNNHALTISADPTMAVAGDRNPWLVSGAREPSDWISFKPDEEIAQGQGATSETARVGNSDSHQGDGQNILFLDSHVNFEKRSYCGTENDNVYTIATAHTFTGGSTKDLKGLKAPVMFDTAKPFNRRDSYLVQENGDSSTGPVRREVRR